MSNRSVALLLAGLLALPCAAQQTPRLLRDLNPTPPPAPESSPRQFFDRGGQTLFAASTEATGEELWITDGTTGGTRMVADLAPGAASSAPSDFAAIGGMVFFCADDGIAGRELWVTDGTAAGTRLFADLRPGAASSEPSSLYALGAQVVFAADDGATGREPWVTDGTLAGTRLLRDIVPGSSSGAPSGLRGASWRGVHYFAAAGLNGLEPWRTDGTPTGTFEVADLNPGSPGSAPLEFYASLQGVYFSADGALGREPFVFDGGVVRQLADVNPVGDSDPAGFLEWQGRVWFRADDGVHGHELWSTDGRSQGTSLVRDLRAGTGSYATPVAALPNALLLVADDGVTGQELWRTDGTTAGTVLLADIHSTAASRPMDFVVVGARAVFSAEARNLGREPWVTDGTAAGTRMLADIGPGRVPSIPVGIFASLRGDVLFSADDGARGREPWISDGTPAGTRLLGDLDAPAPGASLAADPDGFLALGNGRTVFVADDGVHGREPWVTDGTPGGTMLLGDLSPGSGSSGVNGFVRAAGQAWFAANDAFDGLELWATDGTAANTRKVRDIRPFAPSSRPSWLTPFRNGIVFSADDGTHGEELWFSDGTAAGTVLIADVQPGAGAGRPTHPTVLGDRVVFAADDGSAGVELWVTDGTATGTSRISDIHPGAGSSWPNHLVALQGIVLFAADDGASGWELWATDGTAAGTRQVADLEIGAAGSSPDGLTRVGDVVVFRATVTGFGSEPWISDGTPGGTRRLIDLEPGPDGSDPFGFLPLGDRRVACTASAGATGPEPWIFDFSTASTVATPLGDLMPGLAGSGVRDLVAAGARRVFFSAVHPLFGRELWITEGTAATTRPVADLNPSGADSQPSGAVVSRGTLLFGADDGIHGAELFALDLGAVSVSFGTGTGDAVSVPHITSEDPLLGSLPTIRGVGGGAATSAFLLFGNPFADYAAIGHRWHLGVPLVLAFAPVQAGGFSFQLPIPNTPALAGATVGIQCVTAPSQAPLGASTSNGLHLTVGR